MRLTGRQRSFSGGTASDIPGKRVSRAPRGLLARVSIQGDQVCLVRHIRTLGLATL